MMIKEDKRQATYELWFLGDVFNSRVKCRKSLDELLIEAGELMGAGYREGLTVGGIEIICVSADGKDIETVWDFNFADGKFVCPIGSKGTQVLTYEESMER